MTLEMKRYLNVQIIKSFMRLQDASDNKITYDVLEMEAQKLRNENDTIALELENL